MASLLCPLGVVIFNADRLLELIFFELDDEAAVDDDGIDVRDEVPDISDLDILALVARLFRGDFLTVFIHGFGISYWVDSVDRFEGVKVGGNLIFPAVWVGAREFRYILVNIIDGLQHIAITLLVNLCLDFRPGFYFSETYEASAVRLGGTRVVEHLIGVDKRDLESTVSDWFEEEISLSLHNQFAGCLREKRINLIVVMEVFSEGSETVDKGRVLLCIFVSRFIFELAGSAHCHRHPSLYGVEHRVVCGVRDCVA